MKTIAVKVHPAASKNSVSPSSNNEFQFEIYTTAPASDNKANNGIIKILAKYLRLPKSQILLLKGEKNKIKTIGILDN